MVHPPPKPKSAAQFAVQQRGEKPTKKMVPKTVKPPKKKLILQSSEESKEPAMGRTNEMEVESIDVQNGEAMETTAFGVLQMSAVM